MSKRDSKFASMMFLSELRQYVLDNRKKIFFVIIIIVAVTIMAFIKNVFEYNQRYVFDDGVLIGLKEDSGIVSITINYIEDGRSVEKTAAIDTNKTKRKNKKEYINEKPESLNLSKLINHIKSSKALRKNGYIVLPKTFEESNEINWSAPFDYSFLWILITVPLYIFFGYRRKFEVDEREKKLLRTSIIKHLPSFSDNIVLLLESGLIFADAFYRIAVAYDEKEKKDYFEQMIVDVLNESKLTKEEYATVLSRYAAKIHVRAYSRFCNTLIENQKKGTSLVEKLRYESLVLWDARKKVAAERGKIAETKLSLPLSLLLIVLVLITATPAFMQM